MGFADSNGKNNIFKLSLDDWSKSSILQITLLDYDYGQRDPGKS